MSADLETRYPDGIPSGIMSDHMWREFRKADEKWCCKAMRETLEKLPTMRFRAMFRGTTVTIHIDHCPRCGRKLEKA